MRTSAKQQVHGVLGKAGVRVPVTYLFGEAGRIWLAAVSLHGAYAARVDSLLRLITFLDEEITGIDRQMAQILAGDPDTRRCRQSPVSVRCSPRSSWPRSATSPGSPAPGQLCSWAGLTPRHRASDTKVRRGPITKQGSPLLRWACVEAIQRSGPDSPMRRLKERIMERRGTKARNVAKIAAARKLPTLVSYALRDGHVRCLAQTGR
ncbi:transposase [Streptomyces chartreusis]